MPSSMCCRRSASLRQLPKDFPPKSTVRDHVVEWVCDGTLLGIHHGLHTQARGLAGKEARPTKTIRNSQRVKSAERGAHINPVGYDEGARSDKRLLTRWA